MLFKKLLFNITIGFVCIACFVLFRTITKISTPTWMVLIISISVMSGFNVIFDKKTS